VSNTRTKAFITAALLLLTAASLSGAQEANAQQRVLSPHNIPEGGITLQNTDILQTDDASFVEVTLKPSGAVVKLAQNSSVILNGMGGVSRPAVVTVLKGSVSVFYAASTEPLLAYTDETVYLDAEGGVRLVQKTGRTVEIAAYRGYRASESGLPPSRSLAISYSEAVFQSQVPTSLSLAAFAVPANYTMPVFSTAPVPQPLPPLRSIIPNGIPQINPIMNAGGSGISPYTLPAGRLPAVQSAPTWQPRPAITPMAVRGGNIMTLKNGGLLAGIIMVGVGIVAELGGLVLGPTMPAIAPALQYGGLAPLGVGLITLIATYFVD
jgi:hypothetical protein